MCTKYILGFYTHAPVEEGRVRFMARKILTYVVIVVVAILCALNYHLFVFPNQFAPSGLNGICTMIQHLTGINVGYMSLVINIPLAILVYFFVSKPLALRSMVYVAVFSLGLVVLDYVDLSRIAYATDNGTSTILGPVVAGIIYGTCYSLMMRIGTFSASIIWNLDSLDWELPGVDAIVENSTLGVTSGSIILMHDGGGNRDQDVEALPRIIESLQADGYELVTINELLATDSRIPESVASGNATIPEGHVWASEVVE